MVAIKKLVLVLFFLSFFISLRVNEPVYALSCARSNDLTGELAKSSVAFKGTALNPNTAEYNFTVSFDVKTLWKGKVDYIEQGVLVGDMWLHIEKGQEYLILANPLEGHWAANLCGNSKLWSEVSPEQAAGLGKAETIDDPYWRPLYGIVIGCLLILFLTSYLFIQHRRRSQA